METTILETAREIFQAEGIQKTTFRKIGEALGMSDGHVRYYIKTKEDLMLALLKKMDDAIMENESKLEALGYSKEGLITAIRFSFEVLSQYGFFLMESPRVLAGYPRLNEAVKRIYLDRRDFFENLFLRLKKEGTFRTDIDSREMSLAFERFFIVADSWVRFHIIHRGAVITSNDLDYYTHLSVGVFEPYFTKGN